MEKCVASMDQASNRDSQSPRNWMMGSPARGTATALTTSRCKPLNERYNQKPTLDPAQYVRVITGKED